MALWGKADKIYSPGTISVNYDTLTVTGAGTSFTAASEGDVISIGVGKTFGEAVITGIASTSVLTIHSVRFLSGEEISEVEYTISQKPKYTMHDSHYAADKIYGVDEVEAELVRNTQYRVEHSGWVGVQTYMDMHGELRVKTETLVAMSGITTGTASFTSFGDAEDDFIFPDVIITITSQPTSVGVGTTETATFSVTASVEPSNATLNYQWQENDGMGFDDLIGENGTSVSITNTDDTKDGYEYQVIITSGDVSVTSGIATMNVSS